MEPGQRSTARGWGGWIAIAAMVAFVGLLVGSATLSPLGGATPTRKATNLVVAGPAKAPHAVVSPPRLRNALRWLNGLADGLILPTDVTNRLAMQNRPLARMVMAVWSDLNPAFARPSGLSRGSVPSTAEL